MESITLSYSQLTDLMFKCSKEGARQALKELGLDTSRLTRAQVERVHGTAKFNASKQHVKWVKKGTGRTSTVDCDRIEFETWLSKFNEELKPLKNV